ncbi:Single-stranded DNA-binding protein [Paraburkholderia nemoris]|uniref:single-stranded DNA-binding protein n=1 Tax=Paraburkholderia nemoris TaxID=2793076 RepID=UPI00190C5BEF|nr:MULTISPECIES: single-stranded DNA-binding protein [Paraburkholderia]MBK3786046.1 single-stranded DNA-binding protein [Paraburkholderia aspalathi]CAE6847225.1 Single-stranded DNA-binding protein [Paraburkholderia nemoris]
MANRVILTGRLGADPQARHVGDGMVVTHARLASTDHYRDKTTGEAREATEWHRLAFFGRLAEVADKHLVKGSRIYIDGKLRTRKWQSNDGQDRYTTEVVVQHLEMMGGARAGSEGATGAMQPTGSDAPQGADDAPDDWTRDYDEAVQAGQ